MADFRYFAEINGVTVQLTNVGHDGSPYTSAKHFVGYAPDGSKMQTARKIEFKRNPSLHKCDARCEHATGHKCECSCGGKNHGRAV